MTTPEQHSSAFGTKSNASGSKMRPGTPPWGRQHRLKHAPPGGQIRLQTSPTQSISKSSQRSAQQTPLQQTVLQFAPGPFITVRGVHTVSMQSLCWHVAGKGQVPASRPQHPLHRPSQQISDPGQRLPTSVPFALFCGAHWPLTQALIRHGPGGSHCDTCAGSVVSGLLLITHVPLTQVVNWQGAGVPQVLTKSAQHSAQAPLQHV